MSLKLTGGFGPIVGAMKVGKPTVPSWLINLTDTLSTTTQIYINSENPLQLNTPGEYTVEIVSVIATPFTLKAWGAATMWATAGFVSGEFAPEANNIFKIWVGGGGTVGNSNHHGYESGFGGGGRCGAIGRADMTYKRASGGGLSGIFDATATHANSILIAGGAGENGSGGYPTGGTGHGGGAASAGLGGSQTAGGAGGVGGYGPGQAGSALQGGGTPDIGQNFTPGAGGGGYYGGGQGAYNNYSGAGGGGGSSYYDSGVISNFTYLNGDVNASDPHRINEAGSSGGVGLAGETSPPGLFVFSVATE